MPFTVATFQEKAESEIIDSIIEVLHRDMKLALDYFFPADALPDFVSLSPGEDTLFEYPYAVVWLGQMGSLDSNEGFHLDQDLRVVAGIVVKDTTVAAVKKKAVKYVRAFKAVIRTATAADLFPSSNLMFGHFIDIDHVYLRHAVNETGEFTQPVRFDLKFKFGEK